MRGEEQGEAAFERLRAGLNRRDALRASAAVGLGAVIPAWAAEAASAQSAPTPGVLQSGQGTVRGHAIRSAVQNVLWGSLPNKDTKPIRTVASGAVVTFDTVSHEGILEDQGRDPVEFFTGRGVKASDVLRDARAIAASSIEHDFAAQGPHIVTGPVAVRGAQPGDVLKIDVLALTPRVPYGVISSRHGKGALPGEFPENAGPLPGADAAHPERFRNVSEFTKVRGSDDGLVGILPAGKRYRLEFPLDPFMGLIGVALDTSERVDSVPPTVAGGNIDIKNLTVGASLYLPVFVPGAKFFVGDPHYAQGHGEVALTALEAPLRATFRLTRIPKGDPRIPGNRETLTVPFGETAEYWIPVGLNTDLDEAFKQAVREAIAFLSGELGVPRAIAYAYLSAAGDFVVSQVVDKTKGVHGLIRKADAVRR